MEGSSATLSLCIDARGFKMLNESVLVNVVNFTPYGKLILVKNASNLFSFPTGLRS